MVTTSNANDQVGFYDPSSQSALSCKAYFSGFLRLIRSREIASVFDVGSLRASWWPHPRQSCFFGSEGIEPFGRNFRSASAPLSLMNFLENLFANCVALLARVLPVADSRL